jgi:hypothetical protein
MQPFHKQLLGKQVPVETNRAQQQKNGAFDVVRAEKLS